MSILFSLKESLRGMARARMAAVVSITSVLLTLLLIGGFVLAGLNLHQWISVVRAKIEIEVFLQVGITGQRLAAVEARIRNTPGVARMTYVSPEDAARRFEQEFGENVYEVLAFNPFPPSFILTLGEMHRTPEKIAGIKKDLERLPEVDEVVYQKPLLDLIDHYLNMIYAGVLGICAIVIIIAVVLINNTIRLTIYARRDLIQIMRLVGATEGFIRRPFLFEGVFQGLAGSGTAALLLYFLSRTVERFFYPPVVYPWQLFAGLVVFGVLIGLLCAFFSVGKYLKRV